MSLLSLYTYNEIKVTQDPPPPTPQEQMDPSQNWTWDTRVVACTLPGEPLRRSILSWFKILSHFLLRTKPFPTYCTFALGGKVCSTSCFADHSCSGPDTYPVLGAWCWTANSGGGLFCNEAALSHAPASVKLCLFCEGQITKQSQLNKRGVTCRPEQPTGILWPSA